MTNEKPVANPEIVFRKEGDEAILFNPTSGEVKLMNETAAFIYELLDGKHTRERIVALVMEKFDIQDREAVVSDVDAFLAEMREAQLAGEST
jgi:PqqD family protein of HPr-rel-A system